MSSRKPIALRPRSSSASSRRISPGGEYRAFFRPSAVPGTEVLVARHSPLPSHVYFERYAVCVRFGSAKRRGAQAAGESPLPDAESVWLLQPGEVHADCGSDRCMNFIVLFMEHELVAKAARTRGLSQTLRFRTSRSGHAPLLAAVHEYCAAVEERTEGRVQQARFAACLRYVLDFIDRAPPEPQLPPSGVHGAVARAIDLLRHRCNETVTLDELVKVSGLSRFHLVRSFADRVGLTPHAYQIRLRIERAMALLREGLRPGVVASLVGFADQSHLTRHFRRTLRVTPGRYARACDVGLGR
jgi:AraC-like DNA-binding protein